jgi:hypothetical protein
MQYTILRSEETTDRDGNPEMFVQVNFAESGRNYPFAKWLDSAEYAAVAADAAALDDIILSWAELAKRIFFDGNVISPRQARLALLQAGLLDAVEAYISTQPRAVQLEWEYANEIRRDHALLTDAAAALGLSEAQLDELFIAAASL